MAGRERAGIWQRVSTLAQDEASQLPDMLTWCDEHDYEVAEKYVIHGKSAWKGKHAEALDKAFADMAAGKITVLVAWKQDRMERRGMEAALSLVSRAKQAGGRIEFAKEPHLNKLNDMGGRISYAVMAEVAQAESETKSQRILAKHATLRESGSVIGRPPWGYKIVKRDGRKILEPTDDGRKYVPQIFQKAIDGASLRAIAAWLDSEHVPTHDGKAWNEAFLGTRLIKNPVYYGRRRNAGNLETEALIPATMWQEANEAVKSRIKPGRSTVKQAKAFLAPVCGACYGKDREGCPSGKSPMYRVYTGAGAARKPYYRCTGHGPQRKGCGAPMFPVEDLDSIVTEAMLAKMHPHYERKFIPGDDKSDEIAKLRERGAEAMRKGDYSAATEAMREAEALENAPRVAPHWETVETEQTEAEYFNALTPDERREYLARYEVTAELRDGWPVVTIVDRDFTT